VIPPVIAPTVHVKLLEVEAVNGIFEFIPLQVLTVGALVITGLGYTVTTIE